MGWLEEVIQIGSIKRNMYLNWIPMLYQVGERSWAAMSRSQIYKGSDRTGRIMQVCRYLFVVAAKKILSLLEYRDVVF